LKKRIGSQHSKAALDGSQKIQVFIRVAVDETKLREIVKKTTG